MRLAAGLSPRDEAAASIALKNSIYAVSLRVSGRLVGMGRIIGDGGCFYQVVDIAVDPAFQGRGLGKQIMTELMNDMDAHAPAGAYVSLLADVPADRLYQKFGFTYTAPQSLGMFKNYPL
ncbi:GNAT family N-acetyltransferase [Paenibacillus sp. CF384]|uniref:GNAT family N-acetyltransferase n=1 Tax=Paenibacillus sp. CF384 TaxID=1884382 RepID=UPI0035288049